MSAVRHDECKNKPHYFEMFLGETRNPCQSIEPVKAPETDWNQPTRCRHLGDILETRLCNTCGMKGQPYEVRECAVHGVCSERKRDSRVECCLGCFEYEQSPQVPPSPELSFDENRPVKSWAVGITTAPRSQHYTLAECVKSVLANGWKPIVYAEPDSRFDGVPDSVEIVHNPTRLGVWHNWKNAAGDLLKRFPAADAVLTIQDDTVFHPQARWFAEHHFPIFQPKVFSLYTPRHYGQRADVLDNTGKVRRKNLPYESARRWMTSARIRQGWKMKPQHNTVGLHRIQTGSLWGACAMVFPAPILKTILAHKIAQTWLGHRGRMDAKKWRERQTKDPWRIQNSDTAIGKILNLMGIEYWCPTPSLADHIAEASADDVNHGGRGGRRSAAWFAAGDLREIFKS